MLGRVSAPPKPEVDPMTLSKSTGSEQDLRPIKTEPFPEAVTDGRTKINVPFFNSLQHLQEVFQPQPPVFHPC